MVLRLISDELNMKKSLKGQISLTQMGQSLDNGSEIRKPKMKMH